MRAFAALLSALLPLVMPGFCSPAAALITKAAWGETPDHQKVDLYTLTNANGMKVSLSTYGAVIQSLEVPDRNGKMADIVRGFDSLAGYLVPGNSHIGAVIGRYADDIMGAQFTLEGVTYHLNPTLKPATPSMAAWPGLTRKYGKRRRMTVPRPS